MPTTTRLTPQTRARQPWALLPLTALALALASLAGPAAAEDDKRLAQVRDMAKKAQLQAQQAQQESATQRAELAKLKQAQEAQQQSLAETRQRAAKEQSRISAALSEAQAERDQLQTNLATEQAAHTQTRQALAQQEARAQTAERALEEQRRLTARVTGLLQDSVKSLAQAEATNRQLHQLGLKAAESVQAGAAGDSSLPAETLLGLNQVRRESQAEALRQQMDALRLKP